MPYFIDLKARLNRITRINQVALTNKALSQGHIRAFTVDLIRWNQLYKGIDGTGKRLDEIGGGYADSTIRKKLAKGQPTDRVTLFDTGDYYDSIFMIVPNSNDVKILVESNPNVAIGYDLRQDWGNNLTELTDESTRKLALEIQPLIKRYFLDTWNGKTL